jgi:hypothetical protein
MTTKERPILFSSEMVRAILAGRKSQTRRAVKLGFADWQRNHSLAAMVPGSDGLPCFYDSAVDDKNGEALIAMLRGTPGKPCPYGAAGDSLWVRETWSVATGNGHRVVYRADLGTDHWPPSVDVPAPDAKVWKPSIHIRRCDSRITLPVTAVRVERLQDISEADARAEGVTLGDVWESAGAAYCGLWETINGPGSWARNPWVWVVSFGPAQIGGAK